MPIVKSVPVRVTVKKSLAYILNPDKTEDLLYTSSLNCMTDVENAYLNMKMVYEQYAHRSFDEPIPEKGKGRVKAIHYIQSFSPDENITPEQAHRIAKAFVRKTFGDDCQAVIATHTDKKHIHSHIIIITYSLTGRKFNDNQKTLAHVREYSDRVCLAFGIQPLQPKQNNSKSSSYAEWKNKKSGTSWKEQIRMEIDGLIPLVKNVDELFAILEEHGYTVRRGKHISVKAPGQQRSVRLEKLGDVYSLECLDGWIKSELRNAYQSVIGQISGNLSEVQKLSAQLAVINRDRLHSIGEIEAKIEQFRSDCENSEDVRRKYILYSDIAATYRSITEGDYISRLVKEKQQEDERIKKAAKKGGR